MLNENGVPQLTTSGVCKMRNEVRRDIYKHELLIKSCEAETRRVKPLSAEYKSVIELMDKTYVEILVLRAQERGLDKLRDELEKAEIKK